MIKFDFKTFDRELTSSSSRLPTCIVYVITQIMNKNSDIEREMIVSCYTLWFSWLVSNGLCNKLRKRDVFCIYGNEEARDFQRLSAITKEKNDGREAIW